MIKSKQLDLRALLLVEWTGEFAVMQNVRQRILQILQERGQATVADLAEALNMAPVSVRHHLDILQGDGLIRVDGVRRRRGAGRPQHVYALTPEAILVFPKNYEEVLHHLLAVLEEDFPAERVDAFLERVAQRIAREARLKGPEDVLLDQVVAFLNERGYMARWEMSEKGAVISLVNCPYAGLIAQHGRLCRMDVCLIFHLLGGKKEPVLESAIRDGARQCQIQVPTLVPVAP